MSGAHLFWKNQSCGGNRWFIIYLNKNMGKQKLIG